MDALVIPDTKTGAVPTDPTDATYNPLRHAHPFFNDRLFGGALAMPMLSLRNHGRSLGYFAPERFGTKLNPADGEVTDEIAINPRGILNRPLDYTLSVVVHEMVHQLQHHHGKPSRAGYHNKEWAAWMKAIGLFPSNTGLPGGRQTGQQMDHYIVDGGPFALAAADLIATGFSLPYADIWPAKEKKEPETVKLACPGCGYSVRGRPHPLRCDLCQMLLLETA